MRLLRKLCLLLLIVFGVTDAWAQQKAPDLSLKDINGKTFRLADLRGKVVLVNFWATWCAPCRTEIPDLVKKQREYRRAGLRIIGITYPPEKLTEVRRFVRDLKINYAVAVGTKDTKQSFTSSETLPLTVIIDREGTIRGIIEGIMYTDEFEKQVKPLLGVDQSIGLTYSGSGLAGRERWLPGLITRRLQTR
jgi:peroxiredoxin